MCCWFADANWSVCAPACSRENPKAFSTNFGALCKPECMKCKNNKFSFGGALRRANTICVRCQVPQCNSGCLCFAEILFAILSPFSLSLSLAPSQNVEFRQCSKLTIQQKHAQQIAPNMQCTEYENGVASESCIFMRSHSLYFHSAVSQLFLPPPPLPAFPYQLQSLLMHFDW